MKYQGHTAQLKCDLSNSPPITSISEIRSVRQNVGQLRASLLFNLVTNVPAQMTKSYRMPQSNKFMDIHEQNITQNLALFQNGEQRGRPEITKMLSVDLKKHHPKGACFISLVLWYHTLNPPSPLRSQIQGFRLNRKISTTEVELHLQTPDLCVCVRVRRDTTEWNSQTSFFILSQSLTKFPRLAFLLSGIGRPPTVILLPQPPEQQRLQASTTDLAFKVG